MYDSVFLTGQSETSYIVPVIFLSNTLGSPLLPKTIDCEDYKHALDRTEKKEVLKKWYILDGDAQPACYTLQNIEQHIPEFNVGFIIIVKKKSIQSPETYNLCCLPTPVQANKDADKEKASKEWNNEVENMLQALISCFSNELRDTYLTTTVEQVF